MMTSFDVVSSADAPVRQATPRPTPVKIEKTPELAPKVQPKKQAVPVSEPVVAETQSTEPDFDPFWPEGATPYRPNQQPQTTQPAQNGSNGQPSVIAEKPTDYAQKTEAPTVKTTNQIVVEVKADAEWKNTCRKLTRLAFEYTGDDMLKVIISGKGWEMAFPNHRTSYSAELAASLKDIPGVRNVTIQERLL
jgi:hypothetical protein